MPTQMKLVIFMTLMFRHFNPQPCRFTPQSTSPARFTTLMFLLFQFFLDEALSLLIEIIKYFLISIVFGTK